MSVSATLNPYIRLMRLHAPTGIWLLLWPCWWSVALASDGLPDLGVLFLFAIGAIVMRAAGCIINDMVDYKIDQQVERTRVRPLASGELSFKQASFCLAILLKIALVVALLLGIKVVLVAAASLVLVVLYPFMKRITWWPQFFLGLTFNWGALLGWVAVRGTIEWPAVALYIGGIFWTLGYDTIYAHQDKVDDARIGVKSTALRLGGNSKKWILWFYILAIIAWTVAQSEMMSSIQEFIDFHRDNFDEHFRRRGKRLYHIYIYSTVLFAYLLGSQVWRVQLDNPVSCRKIFESNALHGWVLFLGILASKAAPLIHMLKHDNRLSYSFIITFGVVGVLFIAYYLYNRR